MTAAAETLRARATGLALLAVTAAAAVAMFLLGMRWQGPTWQFRVLCLLVGLVLLGLVAGVFLLLRRAARCTVEVDAERVSVRHGSVTGRVVFRSAVVSAGVDERRVRMRDGNGRTLLSVPLRPRRAEVLSALSSYGWPLGDGASTS